MERSPIQKFWYSLEDKSHEEVLELLPSMLKELNKEEKISVLTDLLCEEWHTNDDHKFIQYVLEIYTESIID
ncbi:MAG: hypothetical protein ACI35O_03885 [Bacillaceae bacterium]